MKAPREKKPIQKQPTFDEELDRSRKQALWLRSNYIASILIVAFFALAILRMVSDIRGEYAGTCSIFPRGMAMCSVVHNDKDLAITLILPNTPILSCNTTETELGSDINWTFKPTKPIPDFAPMHLKGKADANSINGVLQDGFQLYTISLTKDPIASVARQLRAFIPGAN
ncbi:MAG TPA: hypothetical protein V6C86_09295 [Oculatellaceae cyanobacterium]